MGDYSRWHPLAPAETDTVQQEPDQQAIPGRFSASGRAGAASIGFVCIGSRFVFRSGDGTCNSSEEGRVGETVQRLSEEKKLLGEAESKLTDTFKAVAGDILDNSTTAFLKLAKEAFDKVLAEAKVDLGKILSPPVKRIDWDYNLNRARQSEVDGRTPESVWAPNV